MKQEEVRMTVRLPKWAADFLDSVADENFTSRNAEIVRAIRLRAQMEAGVRRQTEAPASTPINHGIGATADEYAR